MRTRLMMFCSAVATIQTANNSPRLARHFQPPMTNGKTTAIIKLIANAHFKRTASSGSLARFQRAIGPTPIRNIAGAISGTNTVLKYGGPTESLPRLSASINSGYNVPNKTDPAATISRTLFVSSKDSRERSSNFDPSPTCFARQAYKQSEPPITTVRNPRIKVPRLGSLAKACTEVHTPERTRKVPSRLSEKAAMAMSTVQLLKPPRFSVTASEWINAVPTSHGMNEAFSTGSQNHQPPQPSS